MRASTIISVTALLLSSFTTALPTPNEPYLSLRETTTNNYVADIAARGISAAAKADYKRYKDLTANAATVEEYAHTATMNAMSEKVEPKKTAYKKSANVFHQKLCTMWTEIETLRIKVAKEYADNDPAHQREINGAGAKKKRYCQPAF